MKARIAGRAIDLDVAVVGEKGTVRGGVDARHATASRRSESAPAPLSFTLLGQLVGGKNHIGITRTGRRYPRKPFAAWRDEAERQLRNQLKGCPLPAFPRDMRVALAVRYWPGDRRRRDATALLDALFHLLERCRVVEDDAQVKRVDWQEWARERDPRVEMLVQRWP